MDIKHFLDKDQEKDLLRLLTAGSVDDGKSTLIGRLLFDSKKLYEDQLASLERDSKREGHAGEEIDYALLLDGLKAEREQGITIDVAYRYFSTNKRKFIIADTPGHEQYTRNMITGGSTANLAILLADARKGIITQTKRHTFLVSLLGIKHVVLAINKMDLVDFSQEVFENIRKEYIDFTTQLDIPDITFIPVSALKGDNVVDISPNMPWYHGKSLLEFLETVHIASDRNFEDLRFPVQYVIRPSLDYRGFAGKIASGILRKGDKIMALPSRKTSRIKSILGAQGEVDEIFPPLSCSITLEDEIDISRGEMIVHPNNLPKVERHFEAMLVWMDETDMDPYAPYYIKHNTHTTKARLDQISYKVNVNSMEKEECDLLKLNEIGRVTLTTSNALIFDPYRNNRHTGSFILIHTITHNTVAVGMIIDKLGSNELPYRISEDEKQHIANRGSLIQSAEREKRYGQKGVSLWITGLHGSGKNQLAYALEKELFKMGKNVVVLDGKSMGNSLARELDLSPSERIEYLKQIARFSRLLNEQGILTICSFVSPKEEIRKQLKDIINNNNDENRFLTIHLNAGLEYCKAHDQYGLYEKAEKGEILYMTGIDEEFEAPQNPDIRIEEGDDAAVEKVLHLLSGRKIIFD